MAQFLTLSLAAILIAISLSACRVEATSTENMQTSALCEDEFTKFGDCGP